MLILLLLLVSPNGVESYPAGQCNKKDRSGGNQWFCCNNHEEVNGNCIRCVNGFESFDGSPCMPCPKGLWGGECAKKCSCTKDQICDHILGCINIQIDMPEETTGKTDGLQLTSTMTEFIRFTTFLSHSIKLFTIRGKDTTVWINAPKTTSTTSKPNKNDLGKR
ncbi:Hypothetical predicted protein [Mytilus galloprovincialis]|uniref:Tyrosine-protein kinase ephrin type A/B receptor-like domain-containing protein n=1 Tax=Mytilus galloprovincialis TaxID=29158 RepID=A0A8B6BWQ8_MYTGA|nr:Hypothetical predicted protein [Mytilus galloprovincialis]